METSNEVIARWAEIKQLIETIELDIIKNACGNLNAGVRARHGLRLIEQLTHQMLMMMITIDKAKPKKSMPKKPK